MALKSVLEIDVEDTKFKALVESFKKFQSALKTVPTSWEEGNAAVADMAASIAALNEMLDDQLKKIDRQKGAWDSSRKSVDALVKSTKQISANIIAGTEGLLKWVGIGAAFASTIASGSVFGIDKLAQSVGDARRVAQGLGVSTGSLQSANLNLGRYVDTNNVLGNIADAQNDLGKRYAFGQLGVSGQGTPDEVLARVIRAAKGLYDSGGTTVQAFQARGLQNFMSFEDFRRLGQNSSGDINKSISDFRRDRAQLQLNDKTQKDFQDFAIQIERATLELKNMLVTALGPLIPSLSKLSAVVVKSIETFLKATDLKALIENLGKGITWLANSINDPKFQKGIVDFIDKIKDIVTGLDNLLKFLHIIPGGDNKPTPTKQFGDTKLSFPTNAPAGQMLKEAAAKWGVPAAVLDAIFGAETSHGKNIRTSSAGAKGAMQFMGPTAAQYGVNVNDLGSSFNGAAHYLSDLIKMFHGDLAKAAAAYNWGQGNLQKDIKKHGDHWLEYAPLETQRYVAKTTGVTIHVNNNTGGNANTSVNGAAVGAGM